MAGVALTALASGCSEVETSVATPLSAAPLDATAASFADVTPTASSDPADGSNDSSNTEGRSTEVIPTGDADKQAVDATVSAAYEPPFPDRVDLFVAPKRQGSASQDSTDRAVELMGFVRVDRSRAILSINGETNALAEGDSVGGIEVISVQPPSVVLQRGRQRWQATIE